MQKSSTADRHCALLWDESFLWGIMSFRALKAAGLPFDLVRSEDIRNNVLHNYRMLFVPGGWASNKIAALGNGGIEAIRRFVEAGGNYLGFCGGAGLATLDGIGLLNIRRVPTKDRVPSFSGRLRFSLISHAIWDESLNKPDRTFHVWWPSQFSIVGPPANILAAYEEALPDSFSSDLNVGDVNKLSGGWESLERTYGINLDPARLYGQPAVVEGNFGKGKVVLSLIHFDTPGDENGMAVLKGLWKYLAGAEAKGCEIKREEGCRNPAPPDFRIFGLLAAAEDLIACGDRNFLWFWRNSMLLQWRRGIRGLEYCTLYGMIKTVAEHSYRIAEDTVSFQKQIDEILNILLPFKHKAEKLLLLERKALQDGNHITYEKSDDPAIMQLRSELFANSKSYGGMFKHLLDSIDKMLYSLLRAA
ncbi:MAG TPA: BPL-N domain-containing protein [Dissulfurispiraceae bacterium]|nr:BPL-N domain-containing protein [Dissulfurispiraceae bacterium]